MTDFQTVSVIGCGRWGGFLGYYMATYKHANVLFYGLEQDKSYQELKNTGKNAYLTMPEGVQYTTDLAKALERDFIVVSIGCQNFRGLCRQLAKYDLTGKTFLLAMKGLEENTGKRMTQIFLEEIKQRDVHVAVLGGPGHVQDYLRGVPSCVVIDSFEPEVTKDVADFMNSSLIRVYYGNDLIGNEIGAALKNVIGLAAGILDGLNWAGLKGALMARAPVEVGRFIAFFGGEPKTAYGLSHLGDYEATLFSPHSHNRQFGENFAKGLPFDKLAEGAYTLKAVHALKDKIDMPICSILYEVIYNHKDPKEEINTLFQRPNKQEFKR